MTTKLHEQDTQCQEQSLTDERKLVSLLKSHPDFLHKHPELLTEIDIPHATGGAASLIERQVELLRGKLRASENRLCELMDIARDNERLANSRHRLAVNLLGARELDDVISCVLNELGNELKAEFAVLKLISRNSSQQGERYIDEQNLQAFATMMKHKNPVCGHSTQQQKETLFAQDAGRVASAAIIPLVAGANLGLLGLGSSNENRFHSSMGTEFLAHIGELISAALAVHLEAGSQGSSARC